MRLAVTVKYLLVKRRHRVALFLTLLFIFFCFDSHAQKYRLSFTNLPLSEAVLETSRQLSIKVAFDAGKLGTVIITKDVMGNSSEEFMMNLLEKSGFQFKYKHGSFLILPKENQSTDLKECQLLGTISDRESGEQLPFASVSLLAQNVNTFASENGTFSIKNIVPNPMHLVVSFIGYQPMDTTINWANTSLNCDFRLSRKVQKIDSVLVKGNILEMVDYRNDVDFVTTINASKLIDLPMLTETDIFKTLQLLPGIKYSENSSELSIRGGSSDQNLILYDGQTLYNLSHYFGVFSSLNPNVIKDIQIYKGGYDSRYGERVSGIVDITGKSGNQTKPTIYGDLNMISANLTTEIPLSKKVTLIAAGRRSYADIYSTSFASGLFENTNNSFMGNTANIIEQTKPSYYFYDYNTKLTYRISNNENLSIGYYGGKDYFNNSYSGTSNSLTVETNENNTWSNYGLSASWLKQWKGSFFSNLQAGTSGYNSEYTNLTVINRDDSSNPGNRKYLPNASNLFDSYDHNNLTDYSVSLRNTYYVNNANQLNFGLSARRNDILYHKDADQVYVYDNTQQSAWLGSFYGQDHILLFNNLTIKPGFRESYYDGTGRFYFEPRLSINYKFSEKFSVRMATGKYYQFISQVLSQQETGYTKNFWVLADDSIHPVLRSNHYIVGSSFEIGNFLFDVEGYYKFFYGLQEYLFISQYLKNSDFPTYFSKKGENRNNRQNGLMKISQTQASYFAIGSGKSYGIDFLIRYKLGNFTSWVSYSLGRSLHQFPMINSGNEIPAPTDQKHQVSWTNMLSIKKWNFSTTSLFASGRPYIDYTVNDQNIPTLRSYQRLPDYWRSDFSINYNFNLGRVKMKMGASILNLFNTQNYFDVSTRKFDFDNTSFSETTLIHSQDLSFNLFLHFVL